MIGLLTTLQNEINKRKTKINIQKQKKIKQVVQLHDPIQHWAIFKLFSYPNSGTITQQWTTSLIKPLYYKKTIYFYKNCKLSLSSVINQLNFTVSCVSL